VPLSTAAYFSVGSTHDPSGIIKPASISYLDVVIAETDDVGEAQLLEGYLAWKRGLQATLPLDHPYRWDGTLFGFGPSGYGTTNNYNAHGLGMGLGLGLGSAYNN